MTPVPLLNLQELAAFLNLPPGTIRKWVFKRQIPFYKLSGSGEGKRGVLRFDRRQIEVWLQDRLRGDGGRDE